MPKKIITKRSATFNDAVEVVDAIQHCDEYNYTEAQMDAIYEFIGNLYEIDFQTVVDFMNSPKEWNINTKPVIIARWTIPGSFLDFSITGNGQWKP